jgi:hypothetical protein
MPETTLKPMCSRKSARRGNFRDLGRAPSNAGGETRFA